MAELLSKLDRDVELICGDNDDDITQQVPAKLSFNDTVKAALLAKLDKDTPLQHEDNLQPSLSSEASDMIATDMLVDTARANASVLENDIDELENDIELGLFVSEECDNNVVSQESTNDVELSSYNKEDSKMMSPETIYDIEVISFATEDNDNKALSHETVNDSELASFDKEEVDDMMISQAIIHDIEPTSFARGDSDDKMLAKETTNNIEPILLDHEVVGDNMVPPEIENDIWLSSFDRKDAETINDIELSSFVGKDFDHKTLSQENTEKSNSNIATDDVNSMSVLSQLERLSGIDIDSKARQSNAALVKIINDSDALRDARAVAIEANIRRIKDRRLDHIPLISAEIEPDVDMNDMKGAAVLALLVSSTIATNPLAAAIAIPSALFLSNTKGLSGNAVRAFGGLTWDLITSSTVLLKGFDFTNLTNTSSLHIDWLEHSKKFMTESFDSLYQLNKNSTAEISNAAHVALKSFSDAMKSITENISFDLEQIGHLGLSRKPQTNQVKNLPRNVWFAETVDEVPKEEKFEPWFATSFTVTQSDEGLQVTEKARSELVDNIPQKTAGVDVAMSAPIEASHIKQSGQYVIFPQVEKEESGGFLSNPSDPSSSFHLDKNVAAVGFVAEDFDLPCIANRNKKLVEKLAFDKLGFPKARSIVERLAICLLVGASPYYAAVKGNRK
jgi:hypothetical protein